MSKLVLITGASRGIGAATARLMAEQGHHIIINYVKNEKAASNLCEEIKAQGGKAHIIQADISKESDIDKLFEFVDQFGRLDVLVNNAGVLFTQTKVKDTSVERLQKVLQTNVVGSFICCQKAVERMSDGKGGSIVNVSSLASKSGAPNEYVDYAMSKGAMDSMTIGLAKEVAALNIRVNGVRPGLIKTDIHIDGGEPGRVERLKSKIPLQRGGEAIEVAEAIAWLASDKSSFSTGGFIDVGGGL